MLEDLLSLLGGHWTRMALCVLGQATHEAAALWAGGAAFLEGVAEPGAGGNATRTVVVFATTLIAVLQQRLHDVDQVRTFYGQRRGCAMAQCVGEYWLVEHRAGSLGDHPIN